MMQFSPFQLLEKKWNAPQEGGSIDAKNPPAAAPVICGIKTAKTAGLWSAAIVNNSESILTLGLGRPQALNQ